MLNREFYKGREQTYVKHYVVEHYLERLAIKIRMGPRPPTLNYVDGFAGPWQQADENLGDTSPFIAIDQLRRTKSALAERNKDFDFRCFFIEKNADAYERLSRAVGQIRDVEITVWHGQFEDRVEDVARFATSGRNPFGFFFIDPTGWTGYGMNKLGPLLRIRRSEVLINFMTSFIYRLIDSDQAGGAEGFQDLFGDAGYREEWRDLRGLDREDAIVEAYCRRLQQAGNFSFVGSAVVLNPIADRTCYHLVYGTHHPEGMRVFREVESKAHAEQEGVRSMIDRENRLSSGQSELFVDEALDSPYALRLPKRYRSRAKASVEKYLRTTGRALYDDTERLALSFPLTSSRELKEWIKEWRSRGNLRLEGLAPGERTPKHRRGHYLVWNG